MLRPGLTALVHLSAQVAPKAPLVGKEGHPHDTVRVELLFATTKHTEGCRELNIIIVIITQVYPRGLLYLGGCVLK